MGGVMVSVEDFSKYIALHQDAWLPRDDPEDGPVSIRTARSIQQQWMFDAFTPEYRLLDGSKLACSKGYGYGLMCLTDS